MDQALFELDLYGYTILPAVLSRDEIDRLLAIGTRLEREQGEFQHFLGTARHLSNLVVRDPAYLSLIDHPRVLPIMERLMGDNIILASLNSRIVRPGDGAQGLHGDVPECLRRQGQPIMVNSVWMLNDWTLESGATRVVPGSHRMPQGAPPPVHFIPHVMHAVAPAGSVLIFDGRCWHGGGTNTGTQDRHGLFGHYRVGDWTTFQCDPHQGFNPEWVSQLTERQRGLLRMQTGVRSERWLQDGA